MPRADKTSFTVSSISEYINAVIKLRTASEYINQVEAFDKVRDKLDANGELYRDLYKSYLSKHRYLLRHAINEKDIYGRPQAKFFFRGQNNSEFKLCPGIYREYDKDDNGKYRKHEQPRESYYYHEIITRCPDYFKDTNHLEKLVIMQHYGTPTRLLDVTTNPLVALYFACQGFKTANDGKEAEAGKVFVFFTNYKNVLYPDSARVLMLSCIPKFSYEDQMLLWTTSIHDLDNDKFKKNSSHSYEDKIVESLYHEITTEIPTFKREIKPIDLLWPIFVQPNKANQRILKQDGAFILTGLCDKTTDANYKLGMLSSIELTVKNQEEILKQLDFIGINQASLFPELDMVGDYLKKI